MIKVEIGQNWRGYGFFSEIERQAEISRKKPRFMILSACFPVSLCHFLTIGPFNAVIYRQGCEETTSMLREWKHLASLRISLPYCAKFERVWVSTEEFL
jgi:hypothetical protein